MTRLGCQHRLVGSKPSRAPVRIPSSPVKLPLSVPTRASTWTKRSEECRHPESSAFWKTITCEKKARLPGRMRPQSSGVLPPHLQAGVSSTPRLAGLILALTVRLHPVCLHRSCQRLFETDGRPSKQAGLGIPGLRMLPRRHLSRSTLPHHGRPGREQTRRKRHRVGYTRC